MSQVIDWSVSVIASARDQDPGLPDDAGATLAGALHKFDAAGVATSVGARRIEASFRVGAEDYRAAFDLGMHAWAGALEAVGFPEWPVVQAEVATYDIVEEQLAATALPDLVGVAEVAEMLGVSKQRVSALHRERRLPKPLVRLAAGPIWARAGVEQFVASWDRQGARSRVTAARGGEESAGEARAGFDELVIDVVRYYIAEQTGEDVPQQAIAEKLHERIGERLGGQ